MFLGGGGGGGANPGSIYIYIHGCSRAEHPCYIPHSVTDMSMVAGLSKVLAMALVYQYTIQLIYIIINIFSQDD